MIPVGIVARIYEEYYGNLRTWRKPRRLRGLVETEFPKTGKTKCPAEAGHNQAIEKASFCEVAMPLVLPDQAASLALRSSLRACSTGSV